MMSALCLFNEVKRAFLFSSNLIPRTLSEKIIKFTSSLLLRTNFSRQNRAKTGSWKNTTLHNRQNSSHLRKLNKKLLTSSVQNIINIISNKNTKIEQKTQRNLFRTSKFSSGTAVFYFHKSFPFTKNRFKEERHQVSFPPENFPVEWPKK